MKIISSWFYYYDHVHISEKWEAKTLVPNEMKFSIKDFLHKYDQICRKLRIWVHLLKKSLMENFIFCAVYYKKQN